MANNLPQLKSELLSVLGTTTALDAATKTKIRNAFVTQYPLEWLAYLAGTSDTAAKRGEFVIERTFIFWRERVTEASQAANVAALPPPDTIS
jgi:hypothetical protein